MITMKQFALLNYMIEVNGKTARLVLEPGMPWEDAFEAIERFKTEMPMLRDQVMEDQAKILEGAANESGTES